MSIVLLALMVLFGSLNNSSAQSLSDLKTMKVDELSDEQILAYIKQAENRGLTQSQLLTMARQQGVSQAEINKLRRRVEELGLSSGTTNSTSTAGGQRNAPVTNQGEAFGARPNGATTTVTERQKMIFGFDVFQKNNLTFAPNLSLPTPVDYQLGPNDQILVDLWGATQQFLDFTVSTEGTIRPQNLSPIYVNGLTIADAEKRIIDRLSQIYNGLKPTGSKGPTIFHQISLGNIRTINIEVIGDVARPGVYALNSLSTVYTALHSAGGPTVNGSFRDIRLVRNNELIESVDIYSYLTEGIKRGDVRLKSGDVIIVRPLQSRIELFGEVRRPGFFELKEGEKFNHLLTYAGGFSNAAFKSLVTVKRNGDKEREILDVASGDFSSFDPRDGDLIEVSGILDRFSNRVIIDGAVFREGEYQLTDGLTVKELISKADGLRGDAYMERGTIYRTNEDFSQATIPFDLDALINGDAEDITLSREDVVRIVSIYDLQEEFFVQISGEVQEEGVWPFFNGMTVKDLVILAKGLKESASGALVEISRRNKNSSINSTSEIISLTLDESLSLAPTDTESILQPFDQVYIRKSPGYNIQQQVLVEGEAIAPGQYTISRKDERISDILVRAKGLTQYAYPKGAILIRKTEFSDIKSNDEISQEYLQELRQKVLNDESELKNISQDRLIERLDKIGNKKSRQVEDDVVGSLFKKNSIEGVTKRDSLVRDIKIQEEEPVAIDLKRILERPGSEYDLIVKSGDIISIPGKLETVRVAGEVTSPLNIRYDESFSFKDYIYQSGGFLQSAKKGRSYIQYPNGELRGVKRFLWFKKYPKIEPGSTIFVSRKPEKAPVNFQAIIAAVGSVATLALVVDRLSAN